MKFGGYNMKTQSQMVIFSFNKSDSPVDIEEKLQKATSAMKQQQESRQLPDEFLKTENINAIAVDEVIESILSEIADILSGGES